MNKRMKMKPRTYWGGAVCLAALAVAFPALADEVQLGNMVIEIAYALDTFYFLMSGGTGHVDGRRLRDARGRTGAQQKHRGDSHQECRALLHRVDHVSGGRLQHHVWRRTERRYSRIELFPRPPTMPPAMSWPAAERPTTPAWPISSSRWSSSRPPCRSFPAPSPSA